MLLMDSSEKELNSNGGRWLLSRHENKHGLRGAIRACFPSMETGIVFRGVRHGFPTERRVLFIESQRRIIRVVGGCYRGMETGIDFGFYSWVHQREKSTVMVVGGCYPGLVCKKGFPGDCMGSFRY